MAAAAAPLPVTYSPTTALLVVDVQNDFCHPDGSLSLPGAPGALPTINAHIAAAAAAAAPVVYTADWHPPVTPHFATAGGTWPVHCVADTWGARFLGGLTLVGDAVVRKGVGGEDGYSGFGARVVVLGGDGAAGGAGGGEAAKGHGGEVVDTGLTALLTARGVRSVVIVGVAGTCACGRRRSTRLRGVGDGARPRRRCVRGRGRRGAG
eukprot:TRINITY_DN2640_c0_g1_i2.p2 TRINITY_DN2640_c0_g1~~TRINITY_DN2640_c0_g1_i2.p2  ORF type:complete len:208 (+),score=69.97 TRINITY_DN2640_c0_g1_i2:158-781(+)